MLTYDQCVVSKRQAETAFAFNINKITLKRAGSAECGFLVSAILLELLYGMYFYYNVRRSYPTQIDGKSHSPVINRLEVVRQKYCYIVLAIGSIVANVFIVVCKEWKSCQIYFLRRFHNIFQKRWHVEIFPSIHSTQFPIPAIQESFYLFVVNWHYYFVVELR